MPDATRKLHLGAAPEPLRGPMGPLCRALTALDRGSPRCQSMGRAQLLIPCSYPATRVENCRTTQFAGRSEAGGSKGNGQGRGRRSLRPLKREIAREKHTREHSQCHE